MENEKTVLDYETRTLTIPASRPTYEEVVRAEVKVWTAVTTCAEACGLSAEAGMVIPWPRSLDRYLGLDAGLLMIAHCADWIKSRKPRNTINNNLSSYYYKHVVEDMRRKQGDQVPYTSNDAFIAAAIGLRFKYRFDGLNAYFNISEVAMWVRGAK